jgi:hypothetical protein
MKMKLKTIMEMPITTYSTKERLWYELTSLIKKENITFDDFEKTSLKDIYHVWRKTPAFMAGMDSHFFTK